MATNPAYREEEEADAAFAAGGGGGGKTSASTRTPTIGGGGGGGEKIQKMVDYHHHQTVLSSSSSPFQEHNHHRFFDDDDGNTTSMMMMTPEEINTTRQTLSHQGYTQGLITSLLTSATATTTRMTASSPSSSSTLRIWILDDSGSMNTNDGYRLVETKRRNDVKLVQCTRWEELKECVNYHIDLAGLLRSPTQFRFLNGRGCIGGNTTSATNGDDGMNGFNIAFGEHGYSSTTDTEPTDPLRPPPTHHEVVQRNVLDGKRILKSSQPCGVTPLTERIVQIHSFLSHEQQQRRRHCASSTTDVSIIIATDGIPTNEEGYATPEVTSQFVHSLRSLQRLSKPTPPWIVIRLCTNDTNVVDYYNSLDSELEFPLEVLDDYLGETEEIGRHNPWLNYGLPLHRCREMGMLRRDNVTTLLDLLDERLLTLSELHDFCRFLFFGQGVGWDGAGSGAEGDGVNYLPDPHVDFGGFLKCLKTLVKREQVQWNPKKRKSMAWINVGEVRRLYGDGRGLLSSVTNIVRYFPSKLCDRLSSLTLGDMFLISVCIAVIVKILLPDGGFMS